MDSINSLFGKKYYLVKGRPKEHYEILVKEIADWTGFPYFATHKRIERLFTGYPKDTILDILERWCYEARKNENPGKIINWKMKEFKERV